MNTLFFRCLFMLIIMACGVMIYRIAALSGTPGQNEIRVFQKAMAAETRVINDQLVVHYNKIHGASKRNIDRPEIASAVRDADRIITFYDSARLMIDRIRLSSENQALAQHYMNEYLNFAQQHESLFKVFPNSNTPVNQYLFKKDNTLPKTYLYNQSTYFDLSARILENDLALCVSEYLHRILS